MTYIEENTERLDLMVKTLALEEKQKKRLLEASMQQQKEKEESNRFQLYEGNTNSTTTSMLQQEEAHRKELIDVMQQNVTPATAPIVRVVANVQGKHYT